MFHTGEEPFEHFGCLTFGLWHSACLGELSPLSCGAVLLARGCVSFGVPVLSAMRFHRVGFEDCVFH